MGMLKRRFYQSRLFPVSSSHFRRFSSSTASMPLQNTRAISTYIYFHADHPGFPSRLVRISMGREAPDCRAG